ncbi:MAG: protein phosphatase 2C domain-containing protein, partial [Vagococcus sp.]
GLGSIWKTTSMTEQTDVEKWLVEKIQEENEIIYQEGTDNPEKFGMGTTIVAAVLLDGQMLLAHVGDSRAYMIKDTDIKQLTDDHSLVNELVKTGEITSEMAEKHPKKNILLRSVGVPGKVDVDLSLITVEPTDRVLLCSDGLTNMLSDNDIKNIVLKDTSLKARVEQLIDEANEAGGTDNITALLIDFNTPSQEDKA